MLSYDQSPSSPSLYGLVRSPVSPVGVPTQRGFRPAWRPHHKHVWIVTGPAGCGKSTVAKYLSDQCQFPYIEGDDFHPQTNIEKMRAGIPLTDDDRWDWLIRLREVAIGHLMDEDAVVLTCSALKKTYRDVIRSVQHDILDGVIVHFIYLRASEELLLARVKARKGHYMKSSMIRSQMECLEEPKEEPDVVSIDVSGSRSDVQRLALDAVKGVMA